MDVATYKRSRGLKLKELAEQLGCSKSHASALANGKLKPGKKIAHKLEQLTGEPWHSIVEQPQ